LNRSSRTKLSWIGAFNAIDNDWALSGSPQPFVHWPSSNQL
jgi:hypothetical protein